MISDTRPTSVCLFLVLHVGHNANHNLLDTIPNVPETQLVNGSGMRAIHPRDIYIKTPF